ncbi:Hypothetical protein GLP15_3062 [Giardia lamblia P15]|uniref:Uncharacterized protein n=1 Tax=Giardia intestinalis (strain P15) TaxID=658858 RepID=E1F939_GIAIA|nr:Hypothetical protein GLP15_3062 [Giardia lamblia P15]
MLSGPMAVEPALKCSTHRKLVRSFVTDVVLQARNGSLGPNALYDEFIRRNSSKDICSILAEYIPECNTTTHIQILKKLIARLCQQPLDDKIDSQLNLLYIIISKRLPYREYIHHIVRQSSRFSILKTAFSQLDHRVDPVTFGRLSMTLFTVLETTTPMSTFIQLILAFIKEKFESIEMETEPDSSVTTNLYASFFFRFVLRMQQAYGSFFIDWIVHELITTFAKYSSKDTDGSSKSTSFSSETVIGGLHFFTTWMLQSHNCATAIVWTDYLTLCSCLCQALDKTLSQAQMILRILLHLGRTPDAISTMHEHLMTLVTRPNSLIRHGLAYTEAICWSVRAHTIICGLDYRLFALFSSAIDTLDNKFKNINHIFSTHEIRSVCFLLNAFLKIAPIDESFREKVYRFLERKGANILGLCLLPKSDYPGDTYFHLTSIFTDLAFLFPEIVFNAFLLILRRRHEQVHSLASDKTLLTIVLFALRRFSSLKPQSLSKPVLLQLLQSLERLTLAVHQTDYGFFSLLHDVHQSLISVASFTPGVLCMLITEHTLPQFKQYLCSNDFAQYLGPLSIYVRFLVKSKSLENVTINGITELFERAFVLIASQFQLLRPDTDALQFSTVCELLADIMISGISFSHTKIRPLVSFLPVICAQIHEVMISERTKANKKDACSYLCAIYKVLETISSQAHKYLSKSELHSSLAESMGPDILQCLRLVPDALESVNVRALEQSAMGALVQASKVCPLHDLFWALFISESNASRSTRLVLCRSAAAILLSAGVGAALPFLIVQYGALPDRAIKLSILRTITYAFSTVSLASMQILPESNSGEVYETRCTIYMALLEGTVGIVSHALAERDGSMRLMGMRVAESMMLSCTPIQQGSPLLDHLISMAFPNILDLCDRTLSDAFQGLFEALYYRFGAGAASSFLFAGLFHVAHRVRQAYKLTYDSARLYNGLTIDLFGPSMDELLVTVPTCLQPQNMVRRPEARISALEWTVGRRQHLDYDCAELFMRI